VCQGHCKNWAGKGVKEVCLGRRLLANAYGGEQGSGTFLALATLVLVVGAATPLIYGANQAFEAERLDTAAELSAIAAADSLSGFLTGHPCEVARQVARVNAALLDSCTLNNYVVEVELSSSRALGYDQTSVAIASS
jgi:secretion/DNA translocation related TadE-like protein